MNRTEPVQLQQLNHGDIIHIGSGRFRVSNPYTSNNATQYTLSPADNLLRVGLKEGAPTDTVEREIPQPPALTWD